MIIVKLAELNSHTQEYSLDDGSTVGDLFEVANKTFIDGAVRINQSVVRDITVLQDGDRVFNGKVTKGNLDTFDVSFAKLSDTVTTISAEDGQTIRQVLDAGLSASEREKFFRPDGKPAYEYRIDGTLVEETYVLRRPSGDRPIRVICSQKVKGNK